MLELDGTLQITAPDGLRVDVSATGATVRAEIHSLALRRPSLRLVRSSLVLARRVARMLDRQKLTLILTRDGKPLAELGAGVRGGLGARLLGLSRVRFYRRSS